MYPTQVKKFNLNKKNFYIKELGASKSNILIHILITRSNNMYMLIITIFTAITLFLKNSFIIFFIK